MTPEDIHESKDRVVLEAITPEEQAKILRMSKEAIRVAVAAEREACAQTIQTLKAPRLWLTIDDALNDGAAAIRARGVTTC